MNLILRPTKIHGFNWLEIRCFQLFRPWLVSLPAVCLHMNCISLDTQLCWKSIDFSLLAKLLQEKSECLWSICVIFCINSALHILIPPYSNIWVCMPYRIACELCGMTFSISISQFLPSSLVCVCYIKEMPYKITFKKWDWPPFPAGLVHWGLLFVWIVNIDILSQLGTNVLLNLCMPWNPCVYRHIDTNPKTNTHTCTSLHKTTGKYS